MKQKCFALAYSLFVSIAVLSGCETLPEGVTQQSTAAASAELNDERVSAAAGVTPEQKAAGDTLALQHYVDISGC